MYVSINLSRDEDLLASILGGEVDFPRLREASVCPPKMIVRTRSGGGNREDYEDEIEKLRNHGRYEDDSDCDYDPTYMWFEFSLPPFEELSEETKAKFKEVGIVNWCI